MVFVNVNCLTQKGTKHRQDSVEMKVRLGQQSRRRLVDRSGPSADRYQVMQELVGGECGGSRWANHFSHYPAVSPDSKDQQTQKQGRCCVSATGDSIRDLRSGKHCLSPVAFGNCACSTVYGDLGKSVCVCVRVCIQDVLTVVLGGKGQKEEGKETMLAFASCMYVHT